MDSDPAQTGDSQATQYRILIADDAPFERAAMAQYLRRCGYSVEEAADGEAAINHLKDHEVDAVLLDLNMPAVNGFDVLSYLQLHRRSLPVILLSGMPVEQIQSEIHSLPEHWLPPLLLKPIDLDQLLQLLEMQLSGELPIPPKAEHAQ